MTKKEYFEELKALIDNRREMCEMMVGDLRLLEDKKNSGMYSEDHIAGEIVPEIAKLKREIADHKAKTNDRAKALTERVKKSNIELDRLRGEDLTDDAKLLQGDFPLTAADVQGIIDRNPDNRTMALLAHRYAEQRGLEINTVYHRASSENQMLDGVCSDVGRVIGWMDDDRYYQKIYDAVFDNDAQAAQFCNSEPQAVLHK